MLAQPVTSEYSETEAAWDLIDHCRHHNGTRAAGTREKATSISKLTWDGRKGQWIPLAYSFSFPDTAFGHTQKDHQDEIVARPLASYSFPPSKRHAIMLDQGSPQLRVLPRTTLQGRHIRIQSQTQPQSPLLGRGGLGAKKDLAYLTEEDDSETEIEEGGGINGGWESYDPFNMVDRPTQNISWLEDINIDDFLSSALDYQTDCGILMAMSEPVMDRRLMGQFLGRKRIYSPCTPSSPPPPLFVDENKPIPDFRISPPKFGLS